MSKRKSQISSPSDQCRLCMVVKWRDENHYSTLPITKLPDYKTRLQQKDFVGEEFEISWNDGQLYKGTVMNYGSITEMCEEEDRLEKQAMDASFNAEESIPKGYYAVVYWRQDSKYSVVNSSRLMPNNVAQDDLVGQNIDAKWKGKWLPVTIIATGSNEDMTKELEDRCGFGGNMKKRKVPTTIHSDPASSNSEDTNDKAEESELQSVVDDLESTDKDKIIAELREEVATLKRKYATEEARCKKYRRLINKVDHSNIESSEIEIGDGLKIPKIVDDHLKIAYQGMPMKFLKNLVVKGGLFTLEDLASHSVKGGKCPRTEEVREKLDPKKLKAAFDYTVKCLRLKDDPVKLTKFEINLKDLCTNARKELKNIKK